MCKNFNIINIVVIIISFSYASAMAQNYKYITNDLVNNNNITVNNTKRMIMSGNADKIMPAKNMVTSYLNQARSMSLRSFEESYKLLESAINLSDSINGPLSFESAEIRSFMGNVLKLSGNYKKCISELEFATEIYLYNGVDRDFNFVTNPFLNNLSNNYFLIGSVLQDDKIHEYENSNIYFLKNIELQEKIFNTIKESVPSSLLNSSKNIDPLLKDVHFETEMDYKMLGELKKYSISLASNYILVSKNYYKLGNINQGKLYAQKSIDFRKFSNPQDPDIAFAENIIKTNGSYFLNNPTDASNIFGSERAVPVSEYLASKGLKVVPVNEGNKEESTKINTESVISENKNNTVNGNFNDTNTGKKDIECFINDYINETYNNKIQNIENYNKYYSDHVIYQDEGNKTPEEIYNGFLKFKSKCSSINGKIININSIETNELSGIFTVSFELEYYVTKTNGKISSGICTRIVKIACSNGDMKIIHEIETNYRKK